jgi:hypothetical protein
VLGDVRVHIDFATVDEHQAYVTAHGTQGNGAARHSRDASR